MNPKALIKAQSRLDLAKKAVEEISRCSDFGAFTGHWYAFLTAAKSVYTMLEQGAKTSPQSQQWFGGKKRVRRNDPLLQYVFQARNDDEHGIEPVTERVPGGLSIGVAKTGYSEEIRIDGCLGPGGFLTVTSQDGKPVLIEETLPHAKLVRVHDRGGNCYDPPTEHRGQKLVDNLPLTVAKATIDYLSTLVSEAQELS